MHAAWIASRHLVLPVVVMILIPKFQELVWMQAVKHSQAGLTASLMARVNISRAIVQVMLEGPLSQHSSPRLHRQALRVLNQLHMLYNFLDG